MKILITYQGEQVQLDDIDYEYFNQWNWHSGGMGYIARPKRKDTGIQSTIHLHIEILKRMGNDMTFFLGDHKDRNPFNCQRNNLRPCNKSQNGLNSKLKSNNTVGYRGVYFDSRRNSWIARVRINKRSLHIGYFKDLEKAAKAYDEYAKRYQGEYAQLNFPENVNVG